MSTPTEQRPPQVSLASGIVMFSSVVVLLTTWERVTTLGSLETQEAIRDFLAEAPASGLDLDVSGATEVLRVLSMVAAACACATAILGWYVRKPDRPARLGLTVAAVPLFVSGFVAGGLAGSFVLAGAAMLWLNPAREWFATGRWTPPVVPPRTDAGDTGRPDPWRVPGPGTPPPPGGPHDGSHDVPPGASRPFGEPGPPAHNAYGQPVAPWQPHQAPPQAYAPPPPGTHDPAAAAAWHRRQLLRHRPSAMVTAFVLTVVSAGGLLAMSLLWLALAGLSPEFLMSVIEEQQPQLVEDGLTLAQVRTGVVAIAAVFVVWCSSALVLAGFAMARREWARRGLIISAAFSAGASLALVLSTVLVLIPAAAAVATVVCLRRVEVRRWFAFDPR